jgi:multidrug efflux pump
MVKKYVYLDKKQTQCLQATSFNLERNPSMLLSDISIRRPVFATVMSLLLIASGIVAFLKLPLREYPDIDPPVVSVTTLYTGAAAGVVESRITEKIEERVAGIEGIRFIESSSEDGKSTISIQFNIDRDIESAANDVRDRVSAVAKELPEEVKAPEIRKVDANDEVILWLTLTSGSMTLPQLTDYAERYLQDKLATIDGVARIRLGGGQSIAMRIWLDRHAMAARNITAADVEAALKAENVELPAGVVESQDRQFTVRLTRSFHTADDFKKLVITRGERGESVRIGDIARVEISTVESRTLFRGNGKPMLGLGIIKQSTANTLAVAHAAKEMATSLQSSLPKNISIGVGYDMSVFVEQAVHEVYITFGIAVFLVILVIYMFLGDMRALVIPTVAVPVSIISAFIILNMLGFSLNMLTLLAMILAIGLVVDDAIVVLENIWRRMETLGESALVAAYRGTRQVGFAVIATTMVLVSVFTPIAFLSGDIGRLFSEFALTLSAAVAFSGFVALTLSPMLASKLLRPQHTTSSLTQWTDRQLQRFSRFYQRGLHWSLRHARMIFGLYLLIVGASVFAFMTLPSEYAPKEDRGSFFMMVSGPEGASYHYMEEYMNEIERRLYPLTQNGDAHLMITRAPMSFDNNAIFNSGAAILVLNDWGKRRPATEIMKDASKLLADLPGVRTFPMMRQGFGSSTKKPVQFVLGGGTYEELAQWRDAMNKKIAQNSGLVGAEWTYKETKPQFDVRIDYDRAAALGVNITTIGQTLQTMFGSLRTTTFMQEGEEYDVLLEGQRELQRSSASLEQTYIRSSSTQKLIPLSSFAHITERADAYKLTRYNRMRAITLEANLSDGYALGDALTFLETTVKETLPERAIIDYKGLSQDYKYSGNSMIFVFLLGIAVTYLVLAAQFESFVHPFVIMLTVPLAIAGGLFGLAVMGLTLNLYSQIGLIMLVGLAAKNGILIVEFANQLRDEGKAFRDALIEASLLRLRPILMTSITAAAGAIPLILSGGAGSETRMVIGVVVFFGVVISTLLTLFMIPVAYNVLAQRTGSPHDVSKRLEAELNETLTH